MRKFAKTKTGRSLNTKLRSEAEWNLWIFSNNKKWNYASSDPVTCKQRNLTMITVNSETLTLINCILLYITCCEHIRFSLSEHDFPPSKHMSIFLSYKTAADGLDWPYNRIPDWLFLNANDGSNRRTKIPRWLQEYEGCLSVAITINREYKIKIYFLELCTKGKKFLHYWEGLTLTRLNCKIFQGPNAVIYLFLAVLCIFNVIVGRIWGAIKVATSNFAITGISF